MVGRWCGRVPVPYRGRHAWPLKQTFGSRYTRQLARVTYALVSLQ